jgi:short-subunit dehydrogenase
VANIENSQNRKFAVVTGGSSGIGLELARVFAKNGFDLLVTSGSNKIEHAADELRDSGVETTKVEADLATYDGVEKLWAAIQATGRPLDAIAINAGVGVGGDFARETSLEDELNMIQLNVTSTIHLAKRVLKDMVARGSGKILITSSIAGTMPTPLEAVYGATKAFGLSFAQSLRNELKDTGVTVTALQPGPTNTNFFHRAGLDNTEVGSEGKYTNDPREVAEQGYKALMDGNDHIFASSLKTKVQGELGKFVPESLKAEQHRKMAEPKTGTK